tara:strand:- start:9 stop:428 length:420 start_codon:yes stop_codon:yes gene_type:complete
MNYKIIGKYIKNLDFNIPNPKVFFLISKNISNYKINLDIESNKVEKNIIEVVTSLNLKPIRDDFEKINTKIMFSTVIEILNEKIDKNELEKIILIEVPSQIYNEIRNIFVSLFESSGFKDIKINKTVDFEKLYYLRKDQ